MNEFKVYEHDINEKQKIIIIDIQEISIELEKEMDKYITEIWEGNTQGEIFDVKKQILKFLGEIEEDKKIGAIAEFFIHLYLKINKYLGKPCKSFSKLYFKFNSFTKGSSNSF